MFHGFWDNLESEFLAFDNVAKYSWHSHLGVRCGVDRLYASTTIEYIYIYWGLRKGESLREVIILVVVIGGSAGWGGAIQWWGGDIGHLCQPLLTI